MQLSPLNFFGLIATAEPIQMRETRDAPKRRAIECWKCPDCDDVYERESEAEECCAEPMTALHAQEAPSDCPVCGKECRDARDAADCCLWKDIDAAARYAMADKVAAGSTWAEVLNIHHH